MVPTVSERGKKVRTQSRMRSSSSKGEVAVAIGVESRRPQRCFGSKKHDR